MSGQEDGARWRTDGRTPIMLTWGTLFDCGCYITLTKRLLPCPEHAAGVRVIESTLRGMLRALRQVHGQRAQC
jgi:hypothetical protein